MAFSYFTFRLFKPCLAVNQRVVKNVYTLRPTKEYKVRKGRPTPGTIFVARKKKSLQYPLALRYVEQNAESLCYLYIYQLELSVFRQSRSVQFSKKCPNIDSLLYAFFFRHCQSCVRTLFMFPFLHTKIAMLGVLRASSVQAEVIRNRGRLRISAIERRGLPRHQGAIRGLLFAHAQPPNRCSISTNLPRARNVDA